MTFLNAALAFGSIACAIPLIIHLLNRSRFRVIQWGAMHLLETAIRVNRKRIRLEQWILLFMRMAILALLALCMAGPVVTGWRALTGDAKTSLVVLFDNSYSMEAGRDETTNRARAVEQVREVVSHLPAGSDLAFVPMAGGSLTGSNMSTTDLRRAVDDLTLLAKGFGRADAGRSLERVAKLLEGMQHAKRDLIIVSDFQKSDWTGDAVAARERALQLIATQPLHPSVTLMHAGVQVTDNVCVQALQITPPVVGIRQEVQIRANLRNYGNASYPALRVYLRVDGRDGDSVQIDLGPGEDQQVLFRHTFDKAGSHFIEVSADADPLDTDNRSLGALMVWDGVPVLLINGEPSDEPLRGETDFLEVALTPFVSARTQNGSTPSLTLPTPRGGGKPGPDGRDREEMRLMDLIQTTAITPDRLTPHALADKRVLVLANVSRLSQEQLDAVQQFVWDGNALAIFPGGKVDTEWYNGQMRGEGAALLPLPFAELRRSGRGELSRSDPPEHRAPRSIPVIPTAFSPNRDPGTHSGGTAIAPQYFDHPALAMFNDSRNGTLADAKIDAWYRLGQPEQAEFSGTVLARLETGDPLLVEKPFGRGRVLECATACDDAWSNLPARPFYVPLMQRLIAYLVASVEPPCNVAVGETITARLPDAKVGTEVRVTTPDGASVMSSAGRRAKATAAEHDHIADVAFSGSIVEYTNTNREGLYTIERPGADPLHFVASSSREESDLTQLADDQLQELGNAMGASVVSSAQQYLEVDSTRRYGREIWRQLYWAMLGLACGEVLLQQMFARWKAWRSIGF
jgi:hypothetical protein